MFRLAAAISSIQHVMHLPHIAESCKTRLMYIRSSHYKVMANKICVIITGIKTKLDRP